MKTCTACDTSKPFDDFRRKKASPDGRTSLCKPCAKARDRERYSPRYSEKRLEYQRQYVPANREKIRTWGRESYQRRRVKILAQKHDQWIWNRENWTAEQWREYRVRSARYNKAYRKRHPERQAASNKAYRVKYPGRAWKISKVWLKAHPDILRARLKKYRAQKLLAPGFVSERDIQRLVHRNQGLCTYCKTTPSETIDHVIPLSRGGSNSIGNLTPSCNQCNSSKGGRLLIEWKTSGSPMVPLEIAV